MVSKSKRRRNAAAKAAQVVVVQAPANKPKRKRGRKAQQSSSSQQQAQRGVVTFRGKDLGAMVSVKPSTTSGTVLRTQPLSPHSLNGSRFEQVGKLFSRWRPKMMKIHSTCNGASTTFGSLIVAWVADPTYSPGTGRGVLNALGAAAVSVECPLRSTRVIKLPVDAGRKWYYTDGRSLDDVAHGTLIVAVGADTGGYTGTISANIYVEWVIEFEGAELTATPYDDAFIRPDEGYHDIHTTSDGSWDSSRLTFKQRAGGGMVPFNKATPGIVYTITGNTKVFYKDEDESEKECKFFSLVMGYSVPGLVLHATQADAADYQKTGATAKVLKYTGGSSDTTPSIPTFKAVEVACLPHEVGRYVAPPPVEPSRIDRLEQVLESLIVALRSELTHTQSFRGNETGLTPGKARACVAVTPLQGNSVADLTKLFSGEGQGASNEGPAPYRARASSFSSGYSVVSDVVPEPPAPPDDRR